MLLAISTYLKPLNEVDKFRADHLSYLKSLFADEKLLLAGRQNPPTGAVIIAKNLSHDAFVQILSNDPYSKAGVAEYKIIDFTPALYDELLSAVVELA
ncbi:MAG: YciI family protein [Gammaproteobacteria bacterium]